MSGYWPDSRAAWLTSDTLPCHTVVTHASAAGLALGAVSHDAAVRQLGKPPALAPCLDTVLTIQNIPHCINL